MATTPTANAVPSNDVADLLFNAEKLDEVINSSALTYGDRLGVERMTVAGAVATLATLNPRGDWATATLYAVKDLAKVSTTWYLCVAPHTSGATFAGDAANWIVWQGGVTAFELADPSSAQNGDALQGVLRSETGSQATTQHVANQARDIYLAMDRGAAIDGTTSATTAVNSASTNGGKNRLRFEQGTYATGNLTFSVSRQHIAGLGWTTESSSGQRPGATLLKNANGDHITLSGDDCSLSEIALDGATASYTGRGLVATGQRFKIENVTVCSQRSDGFHFGGDAVNGNLWLAIRPISIDNDGRGGYLNHTGGTVNATYSSGIPDINAGVMIGGDFRINAGVGYEINNAIDCVFIGPAIQDNGGKGLVLKTNNARGHAFFKPYLEGNNGGAVNPGDELDIESGAIQNIVIGNRFVASGGASGYRDVNAPGKNYIITYEDGIGHFAQWGLLGCWNPLTDTTGADARFYKGTSQANIVNHRHTLTGTSGGRWAVETKIDGGAVSERFSINAVGLAALINTTGGLLVGKSVANTTTAGIQIGDSGSGNNTRINMVGSGTASDTRISFYDGSGQCGSIVTSASATAYNTSSDRRLKKNLRAFDFDAKHVLRNTVPGSFDWKATGESGHGYIAQHLNRYFSPAVTKPVKRKDKWQVDNSKMVPVLHVALVDLMQEVDELRTQLKRLQRQSKA